MAINESKVSELEQVGFKRWTKGNLDRLYINAAQLGLRCEYYNTGNVRDAWFDGVSVSNCEARRMKAAKTYIDIKTGQVFGDNDRLKAAAARLAGIDD